MPASRRRFLRAAVAAVTATAGCNSDRPEPVERTVTPVEVPRSDEEYLQQAAGIDSPSVPRSIPVTRRHFEEATAHVESLLASTESRLENAEAPPVAEYYRRARRRFDDPETILEETRSLLGDAREEGPSQDALGLLERAVREVGPLFGGLEADFGGSEPADLRRMLRAEREATADLRSRFEYRLADPIAERLPTLYEAESKLESTAATERADELLDAIGSAGGEREVTARMARARSHLEVHRRDRGDAEAFLRAATDPDAPSLERAVDEAMVDLRAEIERIAETYAGDPTAGTGLLSRFRAFRARFGGQATHWVEALGANRESASRTLTLLDATEWLAEFEAIDAAVEATADRLDGREFPAEFVLEEKRRAVEAVGALSEGSALGRRLGHRAGNVVGAGDRTAQRSVGVETIVQTHFTYAAAAEWAERADSRGSALAESLATGRY